ncbi:methyl-accepting chemotaxis protein [Arsukibacterium sp.]|uniref:methyl-accepting chemotaxis protein n=1 Tax=Arsukibacterium sp. TaxID=1977258 RepID=UPI002FDB0C8B
MKLKVAHKVILGFGFIALLLLFASISALVSFSTVTDSSNRVNQLAVPAQQQSNLAQIQLLKLAKISALGYTAEDSTSIERYQQAFVSEQQAFDQIFSDFSQLVGEVDAFKAPLSASTEHYHLYVEAVAAMFNARLGSIKGELLLQQQLGQLELLIDEAGASLIEISEIEVPRDADLTEVIAGTAGRIDGQILGLLNGSREMAAYTDLNTLEQNRDNLAFSLSDIQSNLSYLESLLQQVDTDGLWETFTEQFSSLSEAIHAEHNLVTLKQAQLQQQRDARQQLNLSEQQSELAIGQLDQLLAAAASQFTTLQQRTSDSLASGRNRTVVLLVVLIALAAAAAYLTISAMLKPLAGINHILGYIAKGDLTRQLAIKQQDEFGALSAKVNSLINALSTLITDIQHNASELSSTASKSSAEVDEISHSLQQQQHQISLVNEVTRQLNHNTKAIAEQANAAGDSMQQAMSQSEQVKQLAATNNQRISTLAGKLTATSELMHRVNDESTNIGSILTTISSIAEQTNLLALNAAIEAARAGEQGRGFAVVADEVRSLAGRTQQATNEIRQMIEHLQLQSKQAVAAVSAGNSEAEGCVATTEQLVAALQQISQAIAQTLAISNQVNHASTAQLKMGSAINDNMTAMVQLADSSTDKAERTLQHSAEVAQLALKLQQAAARFKIG